MDRSRIDPTIYEQSFGRLTGLARLLVLEALPGQEERDAYQDRRRKEMGRPEKPRNTVYIKHDQYGTPVFFGVLMLTRGLGIRSKAA